MIPDLAEARAVVTARGWMRFPGIVTPPVLDRLRMDLDRCHGAWRALQLRNGVGAGTDGTLHHLLGAGTAVDDFVAGWPLHEVIGNLLGGRYVIHACGGFLNLPGAETYVGRVHRDARGFSGDYRLTLNMILMVDDFTEANGASWMLTGSHRLAERPSEAMFAAHAERNLGAAGDVVLFDPQLWHRAGENRTEAPRRALTISYSRPFVKPEMDYARVAGPGMVAAHGDAVGSLIGMDARVPESLDAYYQPPERRAYRA